MNGLLLDTHVWLWYAAGVGGKLSSASVTELENSRKTGGLVVSAISVWELGMQVAKGRIQLSIPFRDWVDRALQAPSIHFLPLDAAAAMESTMLPGSPQGDPADRFLIAAARTQGIRLATHDEHIIAYARSGFVRVLEV